MKWRELGPYLTELWQRPAGPMNWKNPIRVFAVLGWLIVQVFVLLGWAGWRVFQGLMLLGWTVFRVVQFVLALPALLLVFFAGLWYAVWSFVRRPFPSLDEHPILALVQYHTPDFFTAMLLWYYLSPFVAVMLCGVISVTVWKVWLEGRRRDFAPFAKLPPWPLSADQKAPAIVIGEVHHPVEAREIFSPSWLTIPERGLYTGVAIFGAVGSGKTSACMNPFARQLLGWQAGNPHLRAAALVLEVKGDFCHDIRQILVEAGVDKTTSSLAWTPALNGIRSRPGGSIRTHWPTPFRACLISYSARARNPSGSKPIPIWSAGSSSFTGCSRSDG